MKNIICFIFIGVFLFAADYGRISGRVVNSETDEPLVGANIMLEGTEFGSASDEKGEYVVLYVPAGTYTIAASYMGYDPYTYTNVVVNADQTTLLDFRLRPTLIEVQGITAIAERPMVVISQTQTGRAVTSQEMDRLPVTTINQVIMLQAGVVQSDYGTHIRGGRDDEITYFVDGIVTKVPTTGWQSAQINPSATEEITLVSGGFDAEYGDALSGVINIVTKQGGTRHAGMFHYLTDEMFSGNDKLNFGYNRYDFSLGGPVPMTSRLRYFLSGELMLTDASQEALYKVLQPRMDYRVQAKLSYLFSNAKGRITVFGFKERRQRISYMYFGEPNYYKYFGNKEMYRDKNWIASATCNYMVTPRTLASVKVGATHFDWVHGTRDYEWEQAHDRKWYDDYRLKAEHLIDYLLEGNLPVRDVLVDSVEQYHEAERESGPDALRHNPYGIDELFPTYGDLFYSTWQFRYNNDYQMRFDITHSIAKVHEFKTGLDFIQYEVKYYAGSDYYDRSPYKIACYIQDKMDFGGLIARLGIRFDYFNPKAFTFAEPTNLLNDTIVYAETSHKISPRLGFSLPVTDRIKFRFNYGHYFQLPQLRCMYQVTDTAVIRHNLFTGATASFRYVGNISLKPEKTVMYEIGFENQLTDVLTIGFTAYFKDLYNLVHRQRIPAVPVPYVQWFNIDYGNVKGIEFNIKKKMSGLWALGVSYTLQFAKGTSSWALAGGWVPEKYLPAVEYWLDFDERHTINANLDFEFPKNFFFTPLEQFTSSFVFSFHSGHPYTPEDLDGNKLGDVNSARMPGYWNVDWNIGRRIAIGPVNVILNGIIYNLFNTEQVLFVYSTTGRPDDHGDPEPKLSQLMDRSISSSYYSPQADYNHDGLVTREERKQAWMAMTADYYTNPIHYRGSFRVQLGLGIEF